MSHALNPNSLQAHFSPQRIFVTDPDTREHREFPVSKLTNEKDGSTSISFDVNGTLIEGSISTESFLRFRQLQDSERVLAAFGDSGY